MNNYKNVQALSKSLLQNKVDINNDILIGGDKYTFLESSPTNMKSLLSQTNQPKVLLYVLSENSQQSAVALLYASNNGKLAAKKAMYLDINRFRNINEAEGSIENRETIGDFTEIRFTNLSASPFIKGKVDTGATISCLHADSYSIDKAKKQVTFKCSYLSNNSLTLNLIDMQSVQSANGTDYRPVVEMDININGVSLSKMKFNLNDRSEMDAPILVGQNVLEAGKFLIDPSMNEGSLISWPDLSVHLLEAFDMESDDSDMDDDMDDDMDAVDDTADMHDMDGDDEYCDVSKELDDVFTLLSGSDIKLSDLMNHAMTCGKDD